VDRKYKNYILLFFSIFFYSWGAPRFIFVIVGTTVIDFFLVQKMDTTINHVRKKLFLTIIISLNLGLLFYFKYYNFFLENINSILALGNGKQFSIFKIVLPIGISFYTFESLTYVIDVYRGKHKPLTRFADYLLYIILFPKLIAGPIIRYHEIADQITDRSPFDTTDHRITGFFRFSLGLSKKVLIANTMAAVADDVFSMNVHTIDSAQAWIGIISYTFQIYFDFSGYSDMAIGIGQMVGFRFPENFNNPYTSKSITEFWRRWHMTLSGWLNEYLFAPLYTSLRDMEMRGLVLSLFITFFLSGLWHGAGWTFIAFGCMHGIGVIYDALTKKTRKKISKKLPSSVYNSLSLFFTFFYIVIAWVFFRSESLASAFLYIKRMFVFQYNGPLYLDSHFLFYLCLAILFSFFTLLKPGETLQLKVYSRELSANSALNTLMVLTSVLLFVFSLASVATNSFNPFIYFRF
jgi:alginate O-acetyltransferase complex protein AlgI